MKIFNYIRQTTLISERKRVTYRTKRYRLATDKMRVPSPNNNRRDPNIFNMLFSTVWSVQLLGLHKRPKKRKQIIKETWQFIAGNTEGPKSKRVAVCTGSGVVKISTRKKLEMNENLPSKRNHPPLSVYPSFHPFKIPFFKIKNPR